MRLEMGVPNAGTKVVIDIEPGTEGVADQVVEALEVLKVAGDTWREWSLAHETPEEKETRLLMEKNRLLQKQAIERQNIELEQLLEGNTEGIGPLPKL